MGAAGSPTGCIGGRRLGPRGTTCSAAGTATARVFQERRGPPELPRGLAAAGGVGRYRTAATTERREEAAAVTEPPATARKVPLGSEPWLLGRLPRRVLFILVPSQIPVDPGDPPLKILIETSFPKKEIDTPILLNCEELISLKKT